jgi:hypothetical protein
VFNVIMQHFRLSAMSASLLLALLAGVAVSGSSQSDRQDNPSSRAPHSAGVLVLPDGSKFETTLYQLKIIARLKTERKLPYYILAGRGCQECDANTSIYIHSPSNGPMKNEAEQPRFSYPGKVTDYETGDPLYESRMFYGDCLSGHPNAVVWFEHFLGNDKQWHDRVFLAEVRKDNLVTSAVNGRSPGLSEAAEAVRNGYCQELPGIDGPSEP